MGYFKQLQETYEHGKLQDEIKAAKKQHDAELKIIAEEKERLQKESNKATLVTKAKGRLTRAQKEILDSYNRQKQEANEKRIRKLNELKQGTISFFHKASRTLRRLSR